MIILHDNMPSELIADIENSTRNETPHSFQLNGSSFNANEVCALSYYLMRFLEEIYTEYFEIDDCGAYWECTHRTRFL